MKFTFKTIENDNGTRTIHAKGISTNGNEFEGKAVCSPKDYFIFDWGRAIATSRARIKQIKKILANEMIRNEKIGIMQKKSDREIEKLAKQIDSLETTISVFTEA